MMSTRTILASGIAVVLGVVQSCGAMAAEQKLGGKAKSASAQKKLVDFVEAGGCRIKASPDAVARMREIASNGSVAWKGKCQRGLISGAGVLQEEGVSSAGGKPGRIVHHWSGSAVRGIRSGKWKRESFARSVDGPKYWANAATVVFVNGIAKDRATPLPISRLEGYSPAFRRIVAEAERAAAQVDDRSNDSTPSPAAEPKLAASAKLRSEAPTSAPKAVEAASSSQPQAARHEAGETPARGSAEAKAGLVVFTDSRGCKLWSSEAAAKRMNEIASRGAVTWQGVCKNGFISGKGVLREQGEVVVGGRTMKFAYFLSGSADKGVRNGQWIRESFEKLSDNPNFTAGIATVEFVNGVAVGAPKPVAVTSWSQYSIAFSTRILAPALNEQSQSASASDRQPAAVVPDSPAENRAEPVVSPEVTTPVGIPAPPVVPAMAQQQSGSLPAPSVTPPPAKPVELAPTTEAPAPTPSSAPAPLPAPATVTSPASAKPSASKPATTSAFSFSALTSALSSVFGQAPAPSPAISSVPSPAAAPAPTPLSATASVPRRELANVVAAKIKASSTHQTYGPEGLFQVKGPGWHAATPIAFPQELSFEFGTLVELRKLGLLHQDRHPERAPRGYMLEVSTDGNLWTLASVVADACSPNTPDGWNSQDLSKPVQVRFVRMVILSNCGDPSLLTLRGLRVN